MLDEMEPHHFLEWMRFAEVEPIGQEWTAYALLAYLITNEGGNTRYAFTGDRRAVRDLPSFDDFFPGRSERRRTNRMTPAQHCSMLKSMFKRPDNGHDR